jgi:creatinine amidohydrolase
MIDASPSGIVPWWHDLTTDEIAAFVARDPVVVLPVAAVEQHGPHLPLSTDLLLGLGLLARAFQELDGSVPARVLPPQAVGTSLEHVRFPGTLTLEPEVVAEVLFEHGEALARAGVRRLVIHNSHGGNRDVLHSAALRLREAHDMLVVKATYFRFPRPEGVDLPETEWRHGFHGGAVETAMMLHLHPERVRTDLLPDASSLGVELASELRRVGPEGEAPFAWLAGDLHPAGTVGDARLADPGMGQKLVEGYGRALADVIRDARDFPLERLDT